ncbi:MAG TPA: type II secretion system F family protein [Xanthobacteraceae bacterium]|nr:type II secretion system F family protein [Xanthobacteraceae bacterium]
MPSFRYRALTQSGEIVSGSISAPSAAEVAHRIEYLGLVPIETVTEERPSAGRFGLSLSRPRGEDVTVFTRDLALLLKAGARINDALELLSQDVDIGRLRATVAKIRAAVLSGESFADAVSAYPVLFPPMYVALVRVGEASGTLDHILEVLGAERARAEALRRRLADALRYPAFVLLAACAVLTFFLTFVLPQFASVLRDFNAKLDPVVTALLGLSDFVRAHTDAIALVLVLALATGWLLLRQARVRAAIMRGLARLPLIRPVLGFHRTALFCRNLGVLLSSGVALTTTLRILSDMMVTTGDSTDWTKTVERVRHGGKLSDALADTAALPSMAVRMLRLGEETGQLPMLSGRVAEFFEAKLQRSLDRVVGIAGPLAIITISIVVGGLIVSVMTALLSVSQIVE